MCLSAYPDAWTSAAIETGLLDCVCNANNLNKHTYPAAVRLGTNYPTQPCALSKVYEGNYFPPDDVNEQKEKERIPQVVKVSCIRLDIGIGIGTTIINIF